MKFLEDNGYKRWITETTEIQINTEKWQRRVDWDDDFSYPLCQCNSKLHININYFSFQIDSERKHEGYEMFICAENKDSEWCDIKIYSISPYELIDNLKKYESKLLKMWEAFN